VVAAGTPLYTLVDPQDIWLRVFIPEDQIGRVRIGQVAHVSVDSFPGRIFDGRVVEISSHGEFTPGNVQTQGDRVKLVFSVKIQLTNTDDSLKPGMPADAEILVGGQEDHTPR
jgi:HlyD family secretion protein